MTDASTTVWKELTRCEHHFVFLYQEAWLDSHSLSLSRSFEVYTVQIFLFFFVILPLKMSQMAPSGAAKDLGMKSRVKYATISIIVTFFAIENPKAKINFDPRWFIFLQNAGVKILVKLVLGCIDYFEVTPCRALTLSRFLMSLTHPAHDAHSCLSRLVKSLPYRSSGRYSPCMARSPTCGKLSLAETLWKWGRVISLRIFGATWELSVYLCNRITEFCNLTRLHLSKLNHIIFA